ncbi:3-oxo-5a-steroid 4- dehydrogenase [Tulasnella sp. JGI-2019a]|nr:3-oxo-5a-steroid 4- dehydrogenase [Tulasnella sp. JGI-2019a]KAG9015386.1 3-oxo-5a-steroid 4- dehydrogenase [Tulasnella sp. JGI-2019a]KAG9033365.1 3-oxo-5a-steroid 4- dehydrogenase [Tulasnella sp. JGI-2019a]
MPTITVDARGKPSPLAKALPMTMQLGPDETVADIKRNIQLHFPRMTFERQRLTLESKKVLDDAAKAGSLGDVTVYLKDLGPQISWRTVFLVEYLGPLLIHPLLYHCPQIYTYFTKKAFVHSEMQKFVYALVMLHYIKREFESAFVHRFSNATMPAFNIFKNSAHYWFLSGIMLAGSIYGPWYSASALKGSIRNDPTYLYVLAAIWAFAELSNLSVHYTLRNLRPAGTRTRGIPYGYGFNLGLSCPNYFFEIIAWGVVCAMTFDWAAVIFWAVGAGQMIVWASKKHSNYRKEFGSRYPKRNVIFPFVY